jgi:nucleotide-binding universal stress UspA family protein
VVGSRGHGKVAGILLGSVSQHGIAHAHCTVVVVRGDGPEETAGAMR